MEFMDSINGSIMEISYDIEVSDYWKSNSLLDNPTTVTELAPIPCEIACSSTSTDFQDIPSHLTSTPLQTMPSTSTITSAIAPKGETTPEQSLSQLQTNTEPKTKVKKYNCQECSYSTKHRACIFRHSKIHHKDKQYKCDQCCNAYTSTHNLKCHISNKHGEKAPMFMCNMCGKHYKESSWADVHTNPKT